MSSNFVRSDIQSDPENLFESTDVAELDDTTLRAVVGGVVFKFDASFTVERDKDGNIIEVYRTPKVIFK